MFRTVAETEHLPTAAKALHVSPSALSRSVQRLEREVGHALFDRYGRRMKLNPAGAKLLVGVRDAMRRVDDGLAPIGAASTSSIQIVGPPPWLQLIVLPALQVLDARDERTTIDMADGAPADGERALLRGEVDVVLSERAIVSAQVEIAHLGVIAHVLCGRPGGPTGDRALPFAVWTGGHDAWPPQVSRDVVLRTPSLAIVVDACAAGHVQAVLPLAIAHAHGLDLRSAPPLPSTQLYLARRRPLIESVLDTLVCEIRNRAGITLTERALHGVPLTSG